MGLPQWLQDLFNRFPLPGRRPPPKRPPQPPIHKPPQPAPPGAGGADCSHTHTGWTPLPDLGVGTYLGQQGGLYAGGSNAMPASHALAAPSISPVGNVIGMASLGMSNCNFECVNLEALFNQNKDKINPLFKFGNGAVPGSAADHWINPTNPCWGGFASALHAAGIGPGQLQVVLFKMASAIRSPQGGPFPYVPPGMPFPQRVTHEQQRFRQIVDLLLSKYPSVKRVYCYSRIYGGYGTLSPEPWAYENSFSLKWMIEDSINNPGKPPWLAWAGCLWADGVRQRQDGLSYACSDFGPDGTHPADGAKGKVAGRLLSFFLFDATCKGWLAK